MSDEKGNKKLNMEGHWLEFLKVFNLNASLVMEGKSLPFPENSHLQYNFDTISMNINNLT